MVALDLRLGALDSLVNPGVLDRGILIEVGPFHEALELIATKAAHNIVLQRNVEAGASGVALASRTPSELVIDAPRLMALSADDMETALFSDPLAEHDIHATPCHVGGYCYRPGLACLGNNGCLFFMVLGVQHLVGNAFLCQQIAEVLRFLDGDGANEHRAALGVQRLDLLSHVAKLCLLILVNLIGIVGANHGLVGGDDQHLKFIYLVKLLGLGDCGARHPGELFIEAKVVLEGDGGHGHILALNLNPFLGFNGLMQPLGVSATGHHPPSELINDNHLSILDHVIAVPVEKNVRLQGAFQIVGESHVGIVVEAGRL
ncbi:hypothetical protein ES703_08100 [subsurface metagenome]